MKKLLLLLSLCAASASAQMYATTIAAAGSGYSGTVTASISANGSCTTPPTLGTVQLSGGGISSVPVTFGGICPAGGTAPTISISGNGSGASVTGVMIQGTIALLDAPLITSDVNQSISITGQNKLYRYECTLVVPAQFVPFYSAANSTGTVDRMPNTSQSSQIIWTVINGAAALQPLYSAAYAAGILTAYDGALSVNASTTLATVEANIVLNCAQWQTALNAWNPWASYGTYYNGTAWVAVTVI